MGGSARKEEWTTDPRAIRLTVGEIAEMVHQGRAGDMTHVGADIRRWSDLRDFFRGKPDSGDPTVYEVWTWPRHQMQTDLLVTLTKIGSGAIQGEPFHTRGHFHLEPDGPEWILGAAGEGRVELGDRSGAIHTLELRSGDVVWVPPGLAHRVVNPAAGQVEYWSVSSSEVGHDYEGVARLGWR